MHPAGLGNSTLVESVPLRSLHSAIFPPVCLLDRIAYRGIFSAEFKYDPRDREFKLIEINARPWWYVEFAELCGVDVCQLAYQDAMGQPVSQVHTYAVGRRGGLFLHDLRAWKTGGNQHASLLSVLKTWAGADSTPFHAHDPLPGLCYLLNLVKPAPSRPEPAQHRSPPYPAEEHQARLTVQER